MSTTALIGNIKIGRDIRGEEAKKVFASVVEHSKVLGLDPTKTLLRAWWFYLSTYELHEARAEANRLNHEART